MSINFIDTLACQALTAFSVLAHYFPTLSQIDACRLKFKKKNVLKMILQFLDLKILSHLQMAKAYFIVRTLFVNGPAGKFLRARQYMAHQNKTIPAFLFSFFKVFFYYLLSSKVASVFPLIVLTGSRTVPRGNLVTSLPSSTW